MNLIRIPLFIFAFILTHFAATAQGISAWVDPYNYFNMFDNGTMQKLEHLPVRDWKAGGKVLAYVNNVGQFKIYNNNRDRVISENAPDMYEVTDNILVFTLGTQLYVWEDGKTHRLGGWIDENFVYGDSMVAFYDMNRNFNVYYRGEIHFLEQQPVTDQIIVENTLAYIDNMGFSQINIW